jgi:hypothetical protein
MTKQELDILLTHLTIAHRMREDLMKPRVALGNQIGRLIKNAKNRGETITKGDFAIDIRENSKREKEYTKTMIALVKQLPIHDWWCSFKGLDSLGLAAIVAETGDLSDYSNPAKVWRRMGLDVWEGEANKNRFAGVNTGYSKRRRMVAFRTANPIIQHRTVPYREVYDQRKTIEIERDLVGYNKGYVEKHKVFLLKHYTTSKAKILAGRLPQCIINLRAHRYMTKRLLRDLWVEWQRVMGE